MRRNERAVTDKKEIEAIITNADVCRIGLAVDNIPYIVPVNFGYKDNSIYFHCALEGRKLDMLRQNNKVCFEMEVEPKVVDGGGIACTWTTTYQSIIGYGTAEILETSAEKIEGLDIIMAHYSDKNDFSYREGAITSVGVVRIRITQLSGKQLL